MWNQADSGCREEGRKRDTAGVLGWGLNNGDGETGGVGCRGRADDQEVDLGCVGFAVPTWHPRGGTQWALGYESGTQRMCSL